MRKYILFLAPFLIAFIACESTSSNDASSNSEQKRTMKSSITKSVFGYLKDSRTIDLYTLTNKHGMVAEISSFGAVLVKLLVPDKDGKIEDVVLGYDSLKDYENDQESLGATVGRYANRIGKGNLTIEGKQYQLAINNGVNHLHGGVAGFSKKRWEAKPVTKKDGAAVAFTYISKDGEENYPGNLTVTITYSLTNQNELGIEYVATTDQTTVVNLTHHSYFNLNGNAAGDILNHELMLNADHTTTIDDGLIPTGALASVANTPFDFRKPMVIGDHINDDNEQLKFGNGYDHNWVINDWDQSLRLVATLYSPISGRFMETLTTEPGIQIYTGNSLVSSITGKEGKPFKKRQAVCLETQHFPDSPNQPDFPSTLLQPKEKYSHQTVYRFSTK